MAARDDDTRQRNLIIALVVFVILTIGLGVTTYIGFAGQKELDDKLKDAENNKLKAMTKSRDWEQLQALTLKSYLGAPLTKEEQEALAQKYGTAAQEANEPYQNLLKTLAEKNFKWDDAKRQPKETLLARIDGLETQIRNMKEQQAKEADQFKRTRDKLEADLKASEGARETAEKTLADTKTQLADTIKSKSKEFDALTKKNEEITDENDNLKKKAEQDKDKSKKEYDTLLKKNKATEISFQRLKDQVTPVNVFDTHQAKGKIVDLDRRGSTAYIDLGSADNVKPQLTFSVFAASPGGKAQGERKGAVEVIRVLQPHLSLARVIDLRDPGRDPVVAGDLLFNPAWQPGQREHVALTGIIDLTGEGHDDTGELIRNLERQGITVDAYLDLKDMAIKGDGITQQTGFLILGEQPEISDAFATGEGVQGTNRKKELLEKMSEMRADAASKGVAVIPLRRFLSLVGYKVPPTPTGGVTIPVSGGVQRAKAPDKEETGDAGTDKPAKPAPKRAPKDKADQEAPKDDKEK
jgi:hypothetical protein